MVEEIYSIQRLDHLGIVAGICQQIFYLKIADFLSRQRGALHRLVSEKRGTLHRGGKTQRTKGSPEQDKEC